MLPPPRADLSANFFWSYFCELSWNCQRSFVAIFFTVVIGDVIVCLGASLGWSNDTNIQNKDVAPIRRADLPQY